MHSICAGPRWRAVLLCVLLLLAGLRPLSSLGQADGRIDRNKLLLQLSAGFKTVESEGRILLDSSLSLGSKRYKIGKSVVILDGIDDAYACAHSHWMDRADPDSLRKALPGIQGEDHARALLLLGAWYAYQTGASNYQTAIGYLKSARWEAKQRRLEKLAAQAAVLVGKSYFMLEDIPNGRKWIDSVTGDPVVAGYRDVQAMAWNYAGTYCPFRLETTAFRVDCVRKAVDLYGQLGDKGNQINSLMYVAYMSFASGKVDESVAAAKRSLELQKASGIPFMQYTDDLLAFLGVVKQLSTETLAYAYDALACAENCSDSLNYGHFYMRLGVEYSSLSNSRESSKWLQKAVEAHLKMGGNQQIYRVFEVMSSIEWDGISNKDLLELVQKVRKDYPPVSPFDQEYADFVTGNCYLNLGQYSEAKKYLLRAEQLDSLNSVAKAGIKYPFLFYKLAKIHYLTNDLVKSRQYMAKLLAPSMIGVAGYGIRIESYDLLHSIDSAEGNYKAALRDLLTSQDYNRKFLSTEMQRQMNDANIKYETLQKEKNLETLRAQNTLEVQREADTRRLAYIGFGVLGFIVVMLYLRYRNNRKKNRQLEAQKEEIDQQNVELHKLNEEQSVLLNEKEWLLREIHHRVKNNLQVITSLLTSQSVYLRDESAINVMQESGHRVQAMSMIHQKLYNSADRSSVFMPEYIRELVQYLKESFEVKQKVLFDLQIAPIKLDVSKAVPLGLILNEVITNSLKYAFPHTDKDTIGIRLTEEPGQVIRLVVSDNGRGLPVDFDIEAADSFGMILMKGMTEDLEGQFEIVRGNGTQIIVSFNNSPIRMVPCPEGSPN
ncbi:MAG TPA: histidine kinase dimerization/phosphoacceptor domain -containing protein [Puia sp.]